MRTVVVDTNVVSYLMKGHTLAAVYAPHLANAIPALSFMTVAELYEGAIRRGWGERMIHRLENLVESYTVVPATNALCRLWGEIRAARRAQPTAPDDAWIAATAVLHNAPLLTHNPRDFAGVPQLIVETEAV